MVGLTLGLEPGYGGDTLDLADSGSDVYQGVVVRFMQWIAGAAAWDG